MIDIDRYLTTGRMAMRVGSLQRHIIGLCNRNELPHEWHLGCRLIHEDHIELARQKCIERGYIQAPEPAAKSA